MKKFILFTACLLLCTILFGCIKTPTGAYQATGMNDPWEHEGNSITVTGVTVTDSYLAQNGTLYSEKNDDYLVIVRCKVLMASGWSITGHSLTCATSAGTNLCPPSEPLIEVSENGEETRILLFSIPGKEYAGDIDVYHMEIQIASGNYVGRQGFVFW